MLRAIGLDSQKTLDVVLVNDDAPLSVGNTGVKKRMQDAQDAGCPFSGKDVTKYSNKVVKLSVMETGTWIHEAATRRRRRAEYSVETRALCVERHQREMASFAAISTELGIPHDTVRAIVRKAQRTGSVTSAPRSGRPRKTSGHVDKIILEAVRTRQQCSAKTIQEELLRVHGVKLSSETVRRRVLEHTKQQIQSVGGGSLDEALSLTTTVEEKTAHASTAVGTPSAAIVQGELGGTKPVLAYCRHMLREESQSAPANGQLGSLNVVTSTTTEVMQSPLTIGRLPTPFPADEVATVLVAAAATAAFADPESVKTATSSHRDDESSTQRQHKRGEYSIETREHCVALHAQGQGYRRIGKTLSMPHTTVRAIVEKAQRTGAVFSGKRSGRPRKIDAIMDKVILQAVKANERSSARIIKEQLLAVYGVRVSCETIRRRIKDHSRQCISTAGSIAASEEQRFV